MRASSTRSTKLPKQRNWRDDNAHVSRPSRTSGHSRTCLRSVCSRPFQDTERSMGTNVHELRSFALLAVGFSLVSCTKAPEPPQTVTYYREHADERRAMVEQCADDPGTRRNDP